MVHKVIPIKTISDFAEVLAGQELIKTNFYNIISKQCVFKNGHHRQWHHNRR